MVTVFSELEQKQSLKRVRIFLLSTFICCLTYYFVMINLSPEHKDFLPGRLLVCIFSLLGFFCSFLSQDKKYKLSLNCLRGASFSFLFLYMYLLHLNNWSLFYCWSYFILAAILSSSTLNWRAYLAHAILGFFIPLVMGFFSPLSPLALFHFHSANLVVFSLIGISVYTNFQYKKEVAKLTNDLIEQSKMAALGEMAGGISHEINNPLAIIKAAIEQLKRLPPQGDEEKEKFENLAEKITRMVQRIAKITNGMKEFSQDSTLQKIETCDLNEVIEEGLRLCLRKFKTLDIDITFTPTLDKPLYLCKRNQITQIILNLSTNAVEATKHTPYPFIEISLNKNEFSYVISVTDNGVGVPDAIKTRIMEPFFTTKEIGKGLGLGLSASHGFAKAHKGELTLERTKDMTRFNLKLPLTQQ